MFKRIQSFIIDNYKKITLSAVAAFFVLFAVWCLMVRDLHEIGDNCIFVLLVWGLFYFLFPILASICSNKPSVVWFATLAVLIFSLHFIFAIVSSVISLNISITTVAELPYILTLVKLIKKFSE